jgi:hypothetical protein
VNVHSNELFTLQSKNPLPPFVNQARSGGFFEVL